MALSQTAVIERIRELIAEMTGIKRVYGSDLAGTSGLPGGIAEYPSVLVFPGPTILYNQNPGGSHRHEYEVVAQVLFGPVAATAEAAAGSTPVTDALITKFAANVQLGGHSVYAHFLRSEGLTSIAYGGMEYIGYELRLRVVESEAQAFAGGSA
jgi:hypothetical protein